MTAASPASSANLSVPKSAIRACQFCRVRKIKCDTLKPRCGSCTANKRECIYVNEPPKKRPSKAIINGLSKEKKALEDFVVLLKESNPRDRDMLLSSITVKDGKISLPLFSDVTTLDNQGYAKEIGLEEMMSNGSHGTDSMTDEDNDSSAQFHTASILEQSQTAHSSPEHCHSHLIAAAALQLQREHALRHLDYIRDLGRIMKKLVDEHGHQGLPEPTIDAQTPISHDLRAIYPMFPNHFLGFGDVTDPFGLEASSTDTLF